MTMIKRTILLLLLPTLAIASATTSKQIDTLNATGGSGLAVPSVGTKVLSDTNTATITGKTIDCASNTCQHVPIGANQAQEVPSGTVNGSNVTFTLANTPPANLAVMLFLDGLILVQGTDYTISGATITMTTAPATAQKLYAVYNKY